MTRKEELLNECKRLITRLNEADQLEKDQLWVAVKLGELAKEVLDIREVPVIDFFQG